MADLNPKPRKRKSVDQDFDTPIEVIWSEGHTPFVQVPLWVLRCRTINDSARSTWLELASYIDSANREGFPSVTKIAERRNRSRASIFEHFAQLEAAGLIKRTQRRRENGSVTSSLFKLAWEVPFTESRKLDGGSPENWTGPVQKTGPPELDPFELDPNEAGQETSPPSGEEKTNPLKPKPRLRREMTLDEEAAAKDEPLVADKKNPKRPPSETFKLAQFFYEEWARLRMQPGFENLLYPGTQKVIGSRVKYLLGQGITPDQLRQMITAFYYRVATGKVRINSSTLVFAFMADRANSFEDARQLHLKESPLANHPKKWVG